MNRRIERAVLVLAVVPTFPADRVAGHVEFSLKANRYNRAAAVEPRDCDDRLHGEPRRWLTRP